MNNKTHKKSSFPFLLDSEKAVPAIALASTSRSIYRFARILGVLCFLLAIGLVFLPWQQFVSGTGRVVAFDPLDRRANVEAQVAGRVRKSFIVEGQTVKKGDVLVEIMDNDPNLISNLRLQRVEAINRQLAASNRIDEFSRQIVELERSVNMAVEAAEQRLRATESAAQTATLQWDRIRALFADARGLVSARDHELAQLSLETTIADREAAKAALARARADGQAGVNSARASRESARSEVAVAAQQAVVLDSAISQAERQVVEAPRDGIVLSVQVTPGTYLRPGSMICVIIPETTSRFVELWVDGNDMPLIRPRSRDESGKDTPGSLTRLQFEGWPAIQFAGWPAIAKGTFGGEVVFVDPTDNGKGKFRVVVAPVADEVTRQGKKELIPWPSNRWLRQGVRANGWVLLQRVPLWFEVWRQMNGFPPVVADGEPDKFQPTQIR